MKIAIPTKNRPGALRRCLESIHRNASKFGHDVRVIVSDDSDEEMLDQNRDVCAQSALDITYYDRKFREGFVRALAEKADCDPAVVRFALLPDAPVAMGAQRNFLSLLLAGEQFLMLDDDMECKFAPIPGKCDKIRYSLGPFLAHPVEWIPTTSELIDEDFIALHATLFSKGVTLATGGSTGDSGAGFTLFTLSDVAFCQEMSKSFELFETALLKRRLVKTVRQTTIARFTCCTTMCIGLDASKPHPPFLPVERNEDTLFGLMLGNCIPGARSAYCNYAMHHTPNRTADLDWEYANIANLGLGDFMVQWLVWTNPPSLESFAESLEHLDDTGVQHVMLRQRGRVRDQVLENRATGVSDTVAREMDRLISVLDDGGPYKPAEDFSKRVQQYAALLRAWPAITAARSKCGI